MDAVVSLNTKIDAKEKREFVQTAKSLGLTPSAAIKVFVRAFNRRGGFPFIVADEFPPMTREEKEDLKELDKQIANGTAKSYNSFHDFMLEMDKEIAREDAVSHA